MFPGFAFLYWSLLFLTYLLSLSHYLFDTFYDLVHTLNEATILFRACLVFFLNCYFSFFLGRRVLRCDVQRFAPTQHSFSFLFKAGGSQIRYFDYLTSHPISLFLALEHLFLLFLYVFFF